MANQLLINKAKTQAIIVDTVHYINIIDFDVLPSIMVAETPVRFVTEIKYFGIVQ